MYTIPPTTNNLSAQQKTRLIRSTRKLGAVLGTTPCLLESIPSNETKTIKTIRRQQGIHGHSPSSSASSASDFSFWSPSSTPATSRATSPEADARAQGPILLLPSKPSSQTAAKNPSPPLYLRLNALSVPASDPAANALSPTTPTAQSQQLFSPLTPKAARVFHSDARRRKMARVVRTLGENVPTELVFAASTPPILEEGEGYFNSISATLASPSRRVTSSRRRRSSVALRPPTIPLPPTPELSSPSTRTSRRRSVSIDSPIIRPAFGRGATARPPSFNRTRTSSINRNNLVLGPPRGSSLNRGRFARLPSPIPSPSPSPSPPPTQSPPPGLVQSSLVIVYTVETNSEGPRPADRPFATAHAQESRLMAPRQDARVDGEWNMDMSDVQKALRDL